MSKLPSICFVGIDNLAALAPEFGSQRLGGAQLQQTLVARALAAHGYDVSMIVGDFGQPEGATWDRVKTLRAYPPDAGLPVLRFVHPRWTGLWAAADRAAADIYYVSCAGAHVGQMAIYCKSRHRKLIFKVASDADCDPAKLPKVRLWRDKKLYALGLRRADVVFAQSAIQQAQLRKNYAVESVIVPSLVDAGRGDLPFSMRDVPVLWAGAMYDIKRPEILVDIATKLRQIDFHMIGGPLPGGADYFERIKAKAEPLRNVHIYGQKPYFEINAYFERARVLVNTSHTEGFPNTYLQAWVRGTPVVTFLDADGIIEREGLGVVARNSDELANAIVQLTGNPEEWQRVSRRCLDFASRKYGVETLIAPYMNSINQLA